ncbi:MAG: sigma-54-dependent Fis family transcriptional regulator [Magnetospirillum sp.]|nr:MAG: sigma-54-dependent Fis family transcriptional regulator [Magnetospirillum sp.]
MKDARLLIVDDEPHYRQLLSERLSRRGWATFTAASGHEALNIAETVGVDVALIDINMAGMDGLALFEQLRQMDPGIEGIILTGHANVDTAIKAMKLGAFDYLSKPYKLSELEIVVDRAFERRQLNHRCAGLVAQVEHLKGRGGDRLVGESPVWLQAVNMARKAAAQDVPVLVTGDSGSGKEGIAAAIHQWSHRAGNVFVPLNCGALPDNLLESELFGHRRGAFTGAVGDKEGLFQVASSGTLFLDEIGELQPAGQAKLLRVMETGEFRPLGQTALRRTETRVIAATNRDLMAEVKAGRFREDLYYRLNVFSIRVPPLCERRSDIPLLVAHLMARSKAEIRDIEPAAMARLVEYSWPGNVRELRNVVERMLMLVEGPRITEGLIASLISEPKDRMRGGRSPRFDHMMSLDEMDRAYVRWVLAQCDGNISTAARKLKISRSTLYRYVEDVAEPPPAARQS